MKRMVLSVLAAGIFSVSATAMAAERIEQASYSVSHVAPNPALQIRDAARRLRSNDLVGLINALVPPEQLQQARAAYEMQRAEPITERQRAKFAEASAKFIDAGAVDELMTEFEPKLAELRPKQPGAVMMGMGALNMAIESPESDLTDDDRAALRLAMPEIQVWVSTTDFLDPATLRQALTLMADATRRIGIDTIEELKALSFNDALAHGGAVLAAGKQAAALYGLDIDAILDTLQIEVISTKGDSARVRLTLLIFDAPFSREVDLTLANGRWYSKQSIAHLRAHAHDDKDSKG